MRLTSKDWASSVHPRATSPFLDNVMAISYGSIRLHHGPVAKTGSQANTGIGDDAVANAVDSAAATDSCRA